MRCARPTSEPWLRYWFEVAASFRRRVPTVQRSFRPTMQPRWRTYGRAHLSPAIEARNAAAAAADADARFGCGINRK